MTSSDRPLLLQVSSALAGALLLSGCDFVQPSANPCELADGPISANVLLHNSLSQNYEACLAEIRYSLLKQMGE